MIIEVGKNYDNMTVLHSVLMEARRLVPKEWASLLNILRHFLMLSKIMFQFRPQKANDKMFL